MVYRWRNINDETWGTDDEKGDAFSAGIGISTIMGAQQEKNLTITAARGNAARRTQQALAAAQVTNQTVSAEIRAFSNLAGQLDFHSQDGLEYLWWDLLSADAHAGDAGKEFLVGVNPAAYISQGSH